MPRSVEKPPHVQAYLDVLPPELRAPLNQLLDYLWSADADPPAPWGDAEIDTIEGRISSIADFDTGAFAVYQDLEDADVRLIANLGFTEHYKSTLNSACSNAQFWNDAGRPAQVLLPSVGKPDHRFRLGATSTTACPRSLT